jgi:hypothetical protein
MFKTVAWTNVASIAILCGTIYVTHNSWLAFLGIIPIVTSIIGGILEFLKSGNVEELEEELKKVGN